MSADLRTRAVRRHRFVPRRAAAPAWTALALLCHLPALATVCPAPPPPAPAGVCAATAGDAGLLLRGTVLAPGEVLENGHLLLDAAGTIVCAACDCSASPGYATATRIDCLDGVISPGLVNGVDFLNYAQNLPADWGDERFEHRHDWRLGQNGHSQIDVLGAASVAQQRWGELRHLMAGTTAMRGQVGPAGLVRNLDTANLEGLSSPFWDDDAFPFNDTGGTRLDGSCAYGALPAPAPGQPFWMVLAEGIDATAANEFVCASDSSGAAGGVDEIDGALIARGIGITAPDVAEMAAAGSTLVWSPRSNLALYGRTAPLTDLARRGVPLALGTDWIVTGSATLLRELRCADAYNRRYLAGRLSDRDLFEAATLNAAVAGAMDDEIGQLAVGRKGDVVVFDRAGREPYRAVIEAGSSQVALVLRAGKALLGEEAVLAAWTGAACADAAIPVCGRDMRLCLTSEISSDYATLQLANSASYPAFFCSEVLTGEPTCRPARLAVSGGFPVHDGLPKDADFDGDGYANGADNCPVIFNPPNVSPLAQPDADSDGAGDACDFCSTSASATGCGESGSSDLVATLALPAEIAEQTPFAATLAVANAGATAAGARAVLPSLRDLQEVSWTCGGSGGGICPASGTGGLDAAISLPPGAAVTFAIVATHPGPVSAPGAGFVAVAAAIPAAGFGEVTSLDNYAATSSQVVEGPLFNDGFGTGDTSAWSSAVP